MKQKVRTITDIAPTINTTETRFLISLIGYSRKFFPIFSDIIQLLNELTRENVPFKWTDQGQKSLDHVKQIITTSLILA